MFLCCRKVLNSRNATVITQTFKHKDASLPDPQIPISCFFFSFEWSRVVSPSSETRGFQEGSRRWDAPCNGKVEDSRDGADGGGSCKGTKAAPHALHLCPPRGLLEVNLRPVPDLKQSGPRSHASSESTALAKGETAERVWEKARTLTWDPLPSFPLLWVVSYLMPSDPTRRGQVDGDMDVQPVCVRARERTLPNALKKATGSWIKHFYLSQSSTAGVKSQT